MSIPGCTGGIGSKVLYIEPEKPGQITLELVGDIFSPQSSWALASCHYLTGWQIDGRPHRAHAPREGHPLLAGRDQTIGAFPLDVTNVDFVSRRCAQKWMLGAMAIGIV